MLYLQKFESFNPFDIFTKRFGFLKKFMNKELFGDCFNFKIIEIKGGINLLNTKIEENVNSITESDIFLCAIGTNGTAFTASEKFKLSKKELIKFKNIINENNSNVNKITDTFYELEDMGFKVSININDPRDDRFVIRIDKSNRKRYKFDLIHNEIDELIYKIENIYGFKQITNYSQHKNTYGYNFMYIKNDNIFYNSNIIESKKINELVIENNYPINIYFRK